jgi:hypothetical protein
MEAEKAGKFDKGQMGQSLSAMANRGELGLADPDNLSSVGSRQESWVTPRTSGSSTRPNKTSPRQGPCLIEQVRDQVWRTPSSSDGEGGIMEMREGTAGKYKLRDHVADGVKTAKLNPRWVETLMGLPVGWVMPSCVNPITPQGEVSLGFRGGNWMTPEAQNSTGYQISNGQKFLRLGSQVTRASTSPVTIAPTSCDFSATESSLPPLNSPSELFGRN